MAGIETRALPVEKPADNAHPLFRRRHHLVPKLTGHENHSGSTGMDSAASWVI
jgi:hypothetical protein